jgi:DNA-binding CsgD family transcriptional regulator
MPLEIGIFLEQVERAAGLADLQGLVLSLRDSLGVGHIVYHWVSSDGEQYGFGTYDPAWVRHYVESDYLRIDPVVVGCFARFHPVDWRQLDWSSKQASAFQADAIAHGVGNQGYSIPIRGPAGQFALFTVSTDCDDAHWDTFTRAHQRDLILVAHYLNQRALELAKERLPEPARGLSPRETDALTYLAMGYARGQVAVLLAISEHTLRAYIESAKYKLSAMNTTHAVARAMAEGLIVVGGAARQARGDWPGRDEDETSHIDPS